MTQYNYEILKIEKTRLEKNISLKNFCQEDRQPYVDRQGLNSFGPEVWGLL